VLSILRLEAAIPPLNLPPPSAPLGDARAHCVTRSLRRTAPWKSQGRARSESRGDAPGCGRL